MTQLPSFTPDHYKVFNGDDEPVAAIAERTSKSRTIWEETRRWCKANPGKKALIASRSGGFEMTWRQYQPMDNQCKVTHTHRDGSTVYCTLAQGHEGLHIATIGYGPQAFVLASWQQSVDAVDPHASSTGTPTTRDT